MKATNAVTLPDETTVGIRLADQADRDALLAGFERLSPTSRFRRFFTGIPYLSDQMVDRLTAIDQHHHVAVGVFDPTRPSDIDRPDGLGVGVGRYIVSDRDQSRAEFAVAVIDEYQGHGIGTLLLQALVLIAHQRGIETFTADVLAENHGMISVLHRFGATRVHLGSDPTELSYELAIADATAALEDHPNHPALTELADQLPT
ncbi:MAG: N-acetyltransferase [Actinomycetia bacterium]|nr:N-acetyltransferase [Actinomycetes bacterium]